MVHRRASLPHRTSPWLDALGARVHAAGAAPGEIRWEPLAARQPRSLEPIPTGPGDRPAEKPFPQGPTGLPGVRSVPFAKYILEGIPRPAHLVCASEPPWRIRHTARFDLAPDGTLPARVPKDLRFLSYRLPQTRASHSLARLPSLALLPRKPSFPLPALVPSWLLPHFSSNPLRDAPVLELQEYSPRAAREGVTMPGRS